MGRYQCKDFRSLLLEDCIKETKASNKAGVAAVVGKSTFLHSRDIFEKNAFDSAATCLDQLEILHQPIDGSRTFRDINISKPR